MHDYNTGGPVTEGAIVQHLAKTRLRMIEEDLPVPPPLKRGGKGKISTTPSTTSRGTRHAGIDKSNRRRAAAPKAVQAAAVDGEGISQSVKARSKAKKPRKPLSDDDNDSELDGEYDEESEGDTWKPRSHPTKPSGKGAGKSIGSHMKIEKSSDGGMSESVKAGKKYKRSTSSIELAGQDGQSSDKSGAEDSDDKTVSDASGGYVGNNASFLPAESVASSPTLSDEPKSLMVTLKWGNSYPAKLSGLAEAGFVQPGFRQAYAEDEGYQKGLNNVYAAPSDFAIAPIRRDNTAKVHKSSNLHEAAADVQPRHDSTTTMSNRFDAVLANRAAQSSSHDQYKYSMDFDPRGYVGSPYPGASAIGFPSYNPGTLASPSQYTVPQHGPFHQGSHGELLGNPAEMGIAPSPPEPMFPSNFNPDMQGYQPNGFHDIGSAPLNFGYSDQSVYSHGNGHEGFQGHDLPLFDTDQATTTTHSSSAGGCLSANGPSNSQTDYRFDSNFEAGGSGFEPKQQMMDSTFGHFDAGDPSKALDNDDIFNFGRY